MAYLAFGMENGVGFWNEVCRRAVGQCSFGAGLLYASRTWKNLKASLLHGMRD
jgi:hypothetical protein